MKESDEEEKETINREFTDLIVYSENVISLRRSDVQREDEEEIVNVNLKESLQ